MAEGEYLVGKWAYHPASWHMLNCIASPLPRVSRSKGYVLHECPACPDWFYWEAR